MPTTHALTGKEKRASVPITAGGMVKAMDVFEPPVLEHLRQNNHAAYEIMLATMQKAIEKVLSGS